MRKTCHILVATGLIPLGGCIALDEETVTRETPGSICYAWAVSRAGNSGPENAKIAYDELKRRGDISERDLNLIAAGRLVPGMSELAAICVWGGMYDAVNTTVTARGTEKQYVSYSDYRPTYYFYTKNGIVTTVQNWPS